MSCPHSLQETDDSSGIASTPNRVRSPRCRPIEATGSSQDLPGQGKPVSAWPYTPAMPASMFTIGYQGASLEYLIESLAAADVSVVVDTRDTPHSRRPEFRSRSLEAALAEVGIRYLPARALGAPRDLRALATGDWDGFADGYRERLLLVREELESLVPIVASERVCLLCFEADPDACHRSLLAHEIQTLLDVSATHLRPGRPDETDDHEGVLSLGEVAEYEVEVTSR